jgi:tetratricopeptide (TPR) repeat protein
MLVRLSAAALLGSLLALSASAAAEPDPKPAAGLNLRRDARGTKGISPFMAAVRRGDAAALAHDFDAALAAYRDALAKEPENALAYYRIGEAQILKGDLHEAETALDAGLHLVAADKRSLKNKLQFALADLRERQKAYAEASAKWTEYEAFTTVQKDARGFPASAAERIRVLQAREKLSADSAEVKARIDKGLQAADEAVKKSSK